MSGLLPFYVGSLIVGGGLLGTSMLLGGHGHEAEADFDHDHDVSGDHDHDHGHHGPDMAGALWMPILSLRFWTFFCAFFGLTGTLLDGLGLAPLYAALGVSVGMGFLCGYTTSALIRALKTKQVDSGIDPERDYVGKSGDVLQDVAPGDPGLVRLHVKGVLVDVEALVDPDGPCLKRGEKVIVLGLAEGKRLRVAAFDTGEGGAAPGVRTPERRPEPA